MTTSLVLSWRVWRDRVETSPRSWSMQEARTFIRNEMRENLTENPSRRFRMPVMYGVSSIDNLREKLNSRFNGDSSLLAASVKANKLAQKVFGAKLAECIREDDDEGAIALINDNHSFRDRAHTSWADVLDKHFSGSFHQCTDCNHIDESDSGSYAYDDNWVCESCIDDNYRWSDNRDTYITIDDWHEEEDDSDDDDNGDSVIGSYHHAKNLVCHIPSAYDKIDKPAVLLGVELEMEVNDSYNRHEKAQELYDKIRWHNGFPYAFFEDDGSLNHGFEMVTSYTGLDVHAERLKIFKDSPVRGLRSHDTTSCGLHVHVSRAGMTTFHACKLAFFIHDSGNQRLLRAIARRSNSRHAKMVNKKADSQWLKNAKTDGISRLNDDRYEAVNFQNSATVEFRLFKGTLRYESIMACLEFSYNSWFFARDMGVTELTEAKFLDYICQPSRLKHTKFLREYLRSKNFILPIKDKQPKQEVVEV